MDANKKIKLATCSCYHLNNIVLPITNLFMFLKVKHSEKYVNICACLKDPRWHVLLTSIEWQMQDFDKETELPIEEQNDAKLSFIRKSVYGMKQELKLINPRLFN